MTSFIIGRRVLQKSSVIIPRIFLFFTYILPNIYKKLILPYVKLTGKMLTMNSGCNSPNIQNRDYVKYLGNIPTKNITALIEYPNKMIIFLIQAYLTSKLILLHVSKFFILPELYCNN